MKYTIKKHKINYIKKTNKKGGARYGLVDSDTEEEEEYELNSSVINHNINENDIISIFYNESEISKDDNYIHIIFNSLEELNDFFDSDEGYDITNLDLSNNHFDKLPSNIIKLNKLLHLNISNNNFSNELNELTQLESLVSLVINNNQIISRNLFGDEENKNIIDLIPNIINLKELSLEYNNIELLKNNLHIKLPNLEYLNLSYNKFTQISNDILKFDNLKKLDLSNNNITTIPNLYNLKNINLQNTHIYNLPYNIIEFALLNDILLEFKYSSHDFYFFNLLFKQFFTIGLKIHHHDLNRGYITVDDLINNILHILKIEEQDIYEGLLEYYNDYYDYEQIQIGINKNDTIQIDGLTQANIDVPYVPSNYEYKYNNIQEYIGKQIDEAIQTAHSNNDICNKKALEILKNEGETIVNENYNPLNYIQIEQYIGTKISDAKNLAMRNRDLCNMKYLNNLIQSKEAEIRQEIQETTHKIDISIDEYLRKDIDNIVILYTKHNGQQDYIVTQKSKIIKMYNDISHLFFPCMYNDEATIPRTHNLIIDNIYLDLKSIGEEFLQGIHSMFCNIDVLLNSDIHFQLFALIQDVNYYNGFTSLNLLYNQNAVSSWHCQEGTQNSVSHLIIASVNDITSNHNLNKIHLDYYKFKNQFNVYPHVYNMINDNKYVFGNYYKGIIYSLNNDTINIINIIDTKNNLILDEFFNIKDIKNIKQIDLISKFNLNIKLPNQEKNNYISQFLQKVNEFIDIHNQNNTNQLSAGKRLLKYRNKNNFKKYISKLNTKNTLKKTSKINTKNTFKKYNKKKYNNFK